MKSKLAKNLLIIGGVTAGLYVVGGYLKSQGAAADATGYGQIGGEDDRASDAFGSPIYTTPSTSTDGYSYQDLLDAFNQGLAVSPTTDNVDSSGNMSYEDPNVINTLKANSNQDPYVSTPSAEPSLISSLGDVGVIGGAFGANVLLDKSAKGAANAIDIKFPKYADDLAELTPWQKFLKDPYGLIPAKPASSIATDIGTKATKSTLGEVGTDVAISAIPKGWKIAKNVVNFIPLLDIPLGASIDMYLSKKYDPTDNQLNWADAFAANSAGELAQGGITAGGALVGGVGAVPAFIAGVTADVAATEAYYAARGYSSLFGDGRNSGTNPSGAVNMSYEDPAVIADLKKNTPNPFKETFLATNAGSGSATTSTQYLSTPSSSSKSSSGGSSTTSKVVGGKSITTTTGGDLGYSKYTGNKIAQTISITSNSSGGSKSSSRSSTSKTSSSSPTRSSAARAASVAKTKRNIAKSKAATKKKYGR